MLQVHESHLLLLHRVQHVKWKVRQKMCWTNVATHSRAHCVPCCSTAHHPGGPDNTRSPRGTVAPQTYVSCDRLVVYKESNSNKPGIRKGPSCLFFVRTIARPGVPRQLFSIPVTSRPVPSILTTAPTRPPTFSSSSFKAATAERVTNSTTPTQARAPEQEERCSHSGRQSSHIRLSTQFQNFPRSAYAQGRSLSVSHCTVLYGSACELSSEERMVMK